MTFTTVWIQNALGNRWWIVQMPVCTDLTSTQASGVCVQVCCRHASWDETGATRPRHAVSSAPVAVLSEQTPSNVSLWRRARERDGKSTCQSRALPSLQRSALMSWKYSAHKAAVWDRERERDLTRFLRSDQMNSRTKTFWGFHHLLLDNCLRS